MGQVAVVRLGVVVGHLLRLLRLVVGSIDVLDHIQYVGHTLFVLLSFLLEAPALFLKLHFRGDVTLDLLPESL